MLISDLSSSVQESMQQKKVWLPECPVSLSRLKLIKIRHYDFNQNITEGELIVLDNIAQNVSLIFERLLKKKFPINSIKLIDEFHGDDNLSMQKNNSSGFNFRKIANSNKLSMHAYGLAIDINPVQNPFIQNGNILPIGSSQYLDRQIIKEGMVEPVIDIFAEYGFDDWGGNWQTVQDYHHFQIKRSHLDDFL